MRYYLIKFKATPRAEPQIVGCLRFKGAVSYEERQESLARWRKRPLAEGEAMWLDEVTVENAP